MYQLFFKLNRLSLFQVMQYGTLNIGVQAVQLLYSINYNQLTPHYTIVS